MQNRVYVICMYECMYGWYVCPLKAHAGNFFPPKKHGFLGLTPVYSETTKVDSTGYYGIEDPFPDLISKRRRFMGGHGVQIVGCQEPLVVRMP